jgi:cyanophycinase-like exopeptidase
LTDTPIYDQISREFEAGIALADPPAQARVMTQHAAGHSQGEGGRPVSVWALVDQYHAHRR